MNVDVVIARLKHGALAWPLFQDGTLDHRPFCARNHIFQREPIVIVKYDSIINRCQLINGTTAPLVHKVSAVLYVVAQKGMLLIVFVQHNLFSMLGNEILVLLSLYDSIDMNLNYMSNVIQTKDASNVEFLGEHVNFQPHASLDCLNDMIGSRYQMDLATGDSDDLVILGFD